MVYCLSCKDARDAVIVSEQDIPQRAVFPILFHIHSSCLEAPITGLTKATEK